MLTEKQTESLLEKENVVGAGAGKKWCAGKPTEEEAIIVFVEKKMPKNEIINKFSAEEIIPEKIDGIPTDVVEVGCLEKQQGFRTRVRPIKPGYSVGHEKVTAGTIGGIFRDQDNDIVLLSNNHVLACEGNAGIGDIIFQPGLMDNRGARFNGWTKPIQNLPYVGTLKKFVNIGPNNNTQDSAIAKIYDGLDIDDIYPVINDRIAGFNRAVVGTSIQKCGRTTGHTTGQIISTDATLTVGFDRGPTVFKNCIVSTAMSRSGDSGSATMDMNRNIVGLLFAGSDKVTLSNNIEPIRSYYGLQLLPRTDYNIVSSPSSSLNINSGRLTLRGPANHYNYYEVRVNDLNSVSCVINVGSDFGATWGPGIVIGWSNGNFIKINIRRDRVGSHINNSYRLIDWLVKNDGNYRLTISRSNNLWVGTIMEIGSDRKRDILNASAFSGRPSVIRIGKTSLSGNNINYGVPGAVGVCSISGVVYS